MTSYTVSSLSMIVVPTDFEIIPGHEYESLV